MSNKKYTLVAWTEKGALRMVPSLVKIASDPFKKKVESLESQWEDAEDEIGWLLARSRAHEEFARFLLDVGYPREAYEEYRNAAIVCNWCPDELWLQGENCDFPALPLLYRFLSMHRQCVRLALRDAFLRNRYKDSDLEERYLFFTLDDRIAEKEVTEIHETRKAWRFGKTGRISSY